MSALVWFLYGVVTGFVGMWQSWFWFRKGSGRCARCRELLEEAFKLSPPTAICPLHRLIAWMREERRG